MLAIFGLQVHPKHSVSQQKYYDESKKAGNKKTNEAARLKGAGIGMRPSK